MAKTAHIENVRKALADVTGALEDATLIAAEGQCVKDIVDARRTCNRLIAELEHCLARLKRARRRLP